jgi:hypothetical protein
MSDYFFREVVKYIADHDVLRRFCDEATGLDLSPEERQLRQRVVRARNGHPVFVITTEAALKTFTSEEENEAKKVPQERVRGVTVVPPAGDDQAPGDQGEG